MVHEDVIRKYDWNQWYRDIQEWASVGLDDAKADEQISNSPDQHIVFSRVFQEGIPKFIADGVSPLVVQFMQVFCVGRNSIGMIHKDGRDRKCALNVPLRGCGNSVMEWYDHPFETRELTSKTTIVRVTEDEYVGHPTKWPHDGNIRTVIERPTLVNTNIWHRINNADNPENRYIASFRFKDNPTFEEVHSLINS